jgi:NADH pyrophosphatase NudC (nudix superfamily)
MHFTGNTLNRYQQSNLRQSALRGEVAIQKLDRVIYVNNSKFLLNQSNILFPHDTESVDTRVYLGVDDVGLKYWAINVTSPGLLETINAKTLGEWTDMRPASFKVPRFEASLLAQAVSIIDWHSRYKYCPSCGKKVEITDSGLSD